MIILLASVLFVGNGCQQSEKMLRVNLGGNPSTLDPQKTSSARNLSVAIQVFDGLLGFNQDLRLTHGGPRVDSDEDGHRR